MKTPPIPSIPGIKTLSALEMNSIHFSRRHTVLTPAQLDKLITPMTTQGVAGRTEEQPKGSAIEDIIPKPVSKN